MTKSEHSTYSPLAQSFIEETVATTNGWSVKRHDTTFLGHDPIYLYAHDVETSHTWMARVNFDGFVEAVNHMSKEPQEARMIIAAHLGDAIETLVSQRLQSSTMAAVGASENLLIGTTDKSQPGLFDLLTLHAGSTEAVFEKGLLQEGGHFLVLRYPNPDEDGGAYLRSILLPAEVDGVRGVLGGEKLKSILGAIISTDLENAPDLRDGLGL